jgi:hypothetical protein
MTKMEMKNTISAKAESASGNIEPGLYGSFGSMRWVDNGMDTACLTAVDCKSVVIGSKSDVAGCKDAVV